MSKPRSSFGIRAKLRAFFLLSLHNCVWALSKLTPRSKRRWVFGHIDGVFHANPRMLFLWMRLYRPDVRVTWLTDHEPTQKLLVSNGYTAHRLRSLRGVWASLTAKVAVYAHGPRTVNYSFLGGAFLLNLWHGVGLKGIKHGHQGGAQSKTVRRKDIVHRWNYLTYLASPDAVVTTSDFMQTHFATQFRLPPEKCPQLGYPRLDCHFDAKLRRVVKEMDTQLGFTFNPGAAREIYIYMPTFRDTKRPFIQDAFPDLGHLSAILAERGAMLYLKLHPYTRDQISEAYPNIVSWPDEIDVHPYLADFTGLITDYSSVLYDYLLVRDTGAILYTFDFEEYIASDRTLLYPFDENVAGLRVSSFDALCSALSSAEALSPELKNRALAIRQRFWGGSPSPSSPAIVSYVMSHLE